MIILSYGGNNLPRIDSSNTSLNAFASLEERISSRYVIPGAYIGSSGVRRYTNARASLDRPALSNPTIMITFSSGVRVDDMLEGPRMNSVSMSGFHIFSSASVNVLYVVSILSRNLSWSCDAYNSTF